MMPYFKLVQVIAFPDWIIAVGQLPTGGYRCWVLTPELTALDDGEVYPTSQAAASAARFLVKYSLD
ncbi:hypothetical protein [Vasconcelosia minhoensis]|nr:hypothetical protein [Romeria gracilis]